MDSKRCPGVFSSEENIASLRALDSYLKEKLVTWLSPANLQLLNITWDDSASLLEKIVAYEVKFFVCRQVL